MNKNIDYESLFTYISLILAFAIFIVLMYGCLSTNYNNIENFTTTNDVKNAEIQSMTVNATGGITAITLKDTEKGKYYKDKPPIITIAAPPTTGTRATATVVLNTSPISGTNPELFQISSITIGTAGTNYTTDITKITFETIDAYKARNTISEIAEVENIVINTSGEITAINLKAGKKGKYYKDSPPTINILSPTDSAGKQAKAVAKLKSTPIETNGIFHEIESIEITEKGEKYISTDSNKVVIQNMSDYKNDMTPITLTTEQRENIIKLMDGCTALKNKESYTAKINSNKLVKRDVENIISEVSKTT